MCGVEGGGGFKVQGGLKKLRSAETKNTETPGSGRLVSAVFGAGPVVAKV